MMDGAHRLMLLLLLLLLQFEVEVKVDEQVRLLLFCVSFDFVSLQVYTVSTSELPFAQGLSSLGPMSTSSVDSLSPNLPYCSFLPNLELQWKVVCRGR